jgi:uncharacterized protein
LNAVVSATGLPLPSLLLAATMTFGAAAIRGLTGFGMAIVLVPLLSIVIRPDQAVVLAIILQFLIGPVGLRTIMAESHRQSAFTIAGVAMMTTPLGIWALAHTAPDLARVFIALIAIGAFALILATHKAVAQPGPAMTVVTGAAAGVLTGFAAMPGPPVVPYYLRDAFTPHVARASMMLVFFATAIAGTVSALLLGLATMQLALLSLVLLIPMLVGNHLGGLAFGKIPAPVWRTLVAALLGVAGVAAIVRLIH